MPWFKAALAGGSFVVLLVLGLVFVSAGDVVAQGAKSATSGAKVDVNSASQAELEKLPGVGAATAKKIIAGRPYSSVADLSKAGVSKKTLEKITPMVSASPALPPASLAPAAAAPSTPPAPAAAPAAPQKPAMTATEKATPPQVEAKVAPAKGMVWVNTKSKVFHQEGDRWYGKTKEGKFMTEADAVKEGYRPSKEGAAKQKAAKP